MYYWKLVHLFLYGDRWNTNLCVVNCVLSIELLKGYNDNTVENCSHYKYHCIPAIIVVIVLTNWRFVDRTDKLVNTVLFQ